LTAAKKRATDMFTKMKISIAEKKNVLVFNAKTMAEKKKIMMVILLRAEEAKRAAESLKEAERRSKAAKLAWTKTMKEALLNSRKE